MGGVGGRGKNAYFLRKSGRKIAAEITEHCSQKVEVQPCAQVTSQDGSVFSNLEPTYLSGDLTWGNGFRSSPVLRVVFRTCAKVGPVQGL
jgi:hypothetical protein